MKYIKYILAVLFFGLVVFFATQLKDNAKTIYPPVAIVSDAHVASINSNLNGDGTDLIYDENSQEYLSLRSMQAQLTSTRLFNENYYAFIASLDELAKSDVKYIILNGDFTDDGQPMNLKAVADICKHYADTYDMEFFALPGNHDPNRIKTEEGGKDDFLANDGSEFSIYSKNSEECLNNEANLCDDAIILNGYEGIYNAMKDFGFTPKEEYAYYATPYSDYTYDSYNYQSAKDQASLNNRAYEICTEGTGGKYKKDDYTNCQPAYDLSYVVEPVKDVWIMAVDANVYIPDSSTTTEGSGDAGYNKMITHKQQTVKWMQDVATEAKKQGKVLITSSHYPTVDFYNGNSDLIAETFGEDGLSLDRNPKKETTNTIANTNVGMTFSGHMHYNDTGVYEDEDSYLVNVATPSTGAYVPAYKVVTPLSLTKFEVTTNVVSDVADFKQLFKYYQTEYDYRKANNLSSWNKDILAVDNYRDFTNLHIQSLAELRHIDEWPENLSAFLKQAKLSDILIYTNMNKELSFEDYFKAKSDKTSDYNAAKNTVTKQLQENKLSLEDLEAISGVDFTADFYRLMNADELSQEDISPERIAIYSFINEQLINSTNSYNQKNNQDLRNIFTILSSFSNDTASDHFIVDLEEKTITDLSKHDNRIKN